MRDLAEDYIGNAPELGLFFAGRPEDIETIQPISRVWGRELIEEVRRQQKLFGAEGGVNGDEAVIATGQQPALLTGPLYTIYKAITVIHLAERVSRRWGKKVTPLFWLGSDDHDWEEAATTAILNKNHDLVSLVYAPSTNVQGRSLYRIPLEDSLHETIDRAAHEAPGSEWREEIKDFLHDSLTDSESFVDWTARILARLFRDTPLLVFSPHTAPIRRLLQPLIGIEIESAGESTLMIIKAAERLAAMGYEPQLQRKGSDINFFLDVDDLRRKVVYEDNAFHLSDCSLSYSKDQLLQHLESYPERFSANVALRCVAQQRLFSPLAYVGGPGEIAYWAQFKGVFELFGENMPVVYPRSRCMLTTLKLNKLLSKLKLEISDLSRSTDALVERVLRNDISAADDLGIRRFREQVDCHLEELRRSVRAKSRDADGMCDAIRDRMRSDLDRLEKHIALSDEIKNEAVRKQIERLKTSLYPNGKPQERVYNVFSFLFERGWGLIPLLLQALKDNSSKLVEVEL